VGFQVIPRNHIHFLSRLLNVALLLRLCVITMHFLATAVLRMCRLLWRHFIYVTYPTMFQAIPINTISQQITCDFALGVQLKCVMNIHLLPFRSLRFQSHTCIPFTYQPSLFPPPTQHFLQTIHSRQKRSTVQFRFGEVQCCVLSAKIVGKINEIVHNYEKSLQEMSFIPRGSFTRPISHLPYLR